MTVMKLSHSSCERKRDNKREGQRQKIRQSKREREEKIHRLEGGLNMQRDREAKEGKTVESM